MAKNEKRDHNRRMSEGKSSGSYAHANERMGPGGGESAGELPARGGHSLETHGGMAPEDYESRPTPKAPKAPNHTRGQEEDE